MKEENEGEGDYENEGFDTSPVPSKEGKLNGG